VSGITISGGDAANYNLLDTIANTTANITPRALTVIATGINKVYDGTTAATVTLSDNRIAGDIVTDTYTSASFGDKNVGVGKTVTVIGISISGTDAGNYTFNTAALASANITPRTASVTPNPASKIVGAADPIPLTTGALSGFIAADGITATYSRTPGETVGTYTISATLSPASALANYTITYNTATFSIYYNFTGFFQPVDNQPTVNKTKAGSAIPVKFSLHGNFGLNILETGYPKAYEATVVGGTVTDIEETVTAGNSSLNYDATADQYIYVWKTDKSWAGLAIELVVRLKDGTEHKATFTLTK
jgi:hypothetical protein